MIQRPSTRPATDAIVAPASRRNRRWATNATNPTTGANRDSSCTMRTAICVTDDGSFAVRRIRSSSAPDSDAAPKLTMTSTSPRTPTETPSRTASTRE